MAVVQSVPHTLVSNTNFLPGEREQSPTSLQVYCLKYWYPVANQPAQRGLILVEFNWEFLLDRQITKLKPRQIFLLYGTLTKWIPRF